MSNSDHGVDECLKSHLTHFFAQPGNEKPTQIWDMVMATVEYSLLDFIMQKTAHNQTEAAKILGITRNTLRKKLIQHKLL